MLEWTCHICGEKRPDSFISVVSKDLSKKYELAEGTLKQNVRYCNDNQSCIEDAKEKDFLTKEEIKKI